MSADNNVKRPESFARLPGHVFVHWHDERGGFLEYGGRAETLVACGAVTADMLIMNQPNAKGPRRKRRDADDDRYEITRHWRSTDEHGELCEPYRWYYVRRFKEAIDGLPGAAQAVMAMRRYRKWELHMEQGREQERLERLQALAARERQQEEVTKPAQAVRPQLRLVVDNTAQQS